MKLELKEDPKEWRKSAWLSALGVALLSTLLCWRRILPAAAWFVLIALLASVAVSAWLRPPWFRGYYRLSTRLGFGVVRLVGHAVLVVLFFLLVTPLGLALRLLGKDLLRLKHPGDTATNWNPKKECSPLDRLF
ncbi:MAG: hypothetical protein HY298_14655 [Verrucomicrobia bacterium]|nr:hypothetical protein [Verrucomicrobiota bacterium]